MVKVVENGERICTVTLDGSESSVVFQNDYRYFAVQNNSDTDINISLKRGFLSVDDGVMTVVAGSSVLFPHMRSNVNQFFVKGTGKIQVCATNEPINPFRNAPAAGGGGDNRFYLVKDWENVNGAMGFFGYTGLVSSDNGVFIRGYSHFQHIDTKSTDGILRGNYKKIGVSLTADEFYYPSFSKSYVERKYIKLCLLSQRTNSSMFKSINSLDGSLAYNQIDSKYILASTLAPIENVMAYSSVDYAYYNGTFYLDIPDDIETLFIDIESAALNVKINSLWLE